MNKQLHPEFGFEIEKDNLIISSNPDLLVDLRLQTQPRMPFSFVTLEGKLDYSEIENAIWPLKYKHYFENNSSFKFLTQVNDNAQISKLLTLGKDEFREYIQNVDTVMGLTKSEYEIQRQVYKVSSILTTRSFP